MAHAKIIYQGNVMMDITDSTVTPDTLGEGIIAYGADGERIVGTSVLGEGDPTPAPVAGLTRSWDSIVAAGLITVEDNVITGSNADALVGDLVIPEGITELGEYAFDEAGITSLTLPKSLVKITASGINCCEQMERVFFAKEGNLTTIEEEGLFGSNSLTSIKLPEGLTYIGRNAFESCYALKTVEFPSSLEVIGNYAFADSPLETAIFADNLRLKTINGFVRCAFTSFEIPTGITEIAEEAFYGCELLERVTIPDTVTSILGWAFEDCTSLTDITFDGTIVQWSAITLGDKWNKNVPATHIACSDGVVCLEHVYENNICVNCGSSLAPGLYVDGVMTASWDSLVNENIVKVENGVLSAGANADSVRGCDLVIPNDGSVTAIGEHGFQECMFSGVVISGGVTVVGDGAFMDSYLQNVVIDSGVERIGSDAFYNSSLYTVKLSKGLLVIGRYAFEECFNITNITFDGTVAQWNEINKDEGWISVGQSPVTHVTCSDGQVAL